MTQFNEQDTQTRREKPTLFCPGCGHEGHITAAWIETTVEDSKILSCPDCGTKIDERGSGSPRPPAEAD